MPVAWRWRLERSDGTDVTDAVGGGTGGGSGGGAAVGDAGPEGGAPTLSLRPAAEGFPTQSDAESWLGETWRELLAAGVDQVRLFEDDTEVYGPMSLHAPD